MILTKTNVVFNQPIEIEIKAPKVPVRGEGLDHTQIQTVITQLKDDGFDEGAIVVRRKDSRWERKRPSSWGIITNMVKWRQYQNPGWDPIQVKWIMNGQLTNHWGEDLLVIYEPYTTLELDDLFDGQE